MKPQSSKQLLEQSHPLLRFYQEPIHLQLKLRTKWCQLKFIQLKRKCYFILFTRLEHLGPITTSRRGSF